MNVERLKDWIFNGDIGISSLTMASALMGVKYLGANQPFDITDFKRCRDFTKYVEMNEKDFLKVVETYPWWQHVLDLWQELEQAYEKRDAKAIHTLLHCNECYGKIRQERLEQARKERII